MHCISRIFFYCSGQNKTLTFGKEENVIGYLIWGYDK